MSSSQELQQCIAITEEGNRCSRPARDGEFCYQHDESDDTVQDVDTKEPAESEREQQMSDDERGQQMQEASQSAEQDEERESESSEVEEEGDTRAQEHEASEETKESEEADESVEITSRSEREEEGESGDDESSEVSGGELDIAQIREHVSDVAGEIVGYPLDGIARIEPNETGAMVAIEVIERSGIPDTQDIIGRYELDLDDALTVASYQRTHRYRRDDMEHDI